MPGDIVVLSAGNLVPADGIVLEARDFLVSEASLTGESFPVEKQPGVVPRRHAGRRPHQLRVPRHLGAQRHGHGTGRADRSRHRVRRDRGADRSTAARRPSSRAACASSATC